MKLKEQEKDKLIDRLKMEITQLKSDKEGLKNQLKQEMLHTQSLSNQINSRTSEAKLTAVKQEIPVVNIKGFN